VDFPKFKIKCLKSTERGENKFWLEWKRKKIQIEKLCSKNKSNLNKPTPIIILVMIQTLENILGKSLITLIRFAMKLQKIALKINGLTLLFFGKTNAKKSL
jgi:hypothetical protein